MEMLKLQLALDKVEGSSGGELILAFTGIDGKGRTPGDNWNIPNIIESIINKNRGVEDYEVYKESPMYEITLTPALMKTIREYNKKMNNIMKCWFILKNIKKTYINLW